MNFNEKVWDALKEIPRGKVTTYKEIAKRVGSRKAFRAVGNACNKNPHSPKVPCHRVVSSDGSIWGYAHGPRAKKKLLAKEGIEIADGKIVDFERKLFKF